MKSQSNDLQAALDRILMTLTVFEDVRAVGLIGSCATGAADSFSDVDVLVVASKAVPTGEERLRQYQAVGLGESIAFDADLGPVRRDLVRADDFLLDLHWTAVPVAERFLQDLARDFDCDELLPEGVASASALYDPHEALVKLAKAVPEYPAERAKHRVWRALREARREFEVLRRLEGAVLRGDAWAFAAARQGLVEALVLGLFALNRAWYRPRAGMLERVREFAKGPKDAAGRIEAVLLGRDGDMAAAYDEIQRLFEELKDQG